MLDVINIHKKLSISVLQSYTGPAFPFSGENYLFAPGPNNYSTSMMTTVPLSFSKWKQDNACYFVCSNFHPMPITILSSFFRFNFFNRFSWLLLAHLSWKLKWAFLITCRPSAVCLSVCPSVCKLFTFSSSSQEPLGQFQPNLHKASLGKGDSSLFKWRAPPFSKGR